MVNMKKVALYVGAVGALASVGAWLLPTSASSQSTTGNNSPAISGNGNSVNYVSGFPDLKTIQAQRPNISDEQYDAIKKGMSYQQVLDIVKIPGREVSSNDNVIVYTWGNELYIYMMVTLIDGKVHSKHR
ncbi:hypothetical protein J4P02_03540 [Pseudomonas sp. NFXW11]|uniref:hypothetical protein n=1 Tax=Pseudomonas sp. NFXW11 TaxID=2819531 RepID=UPI003CE7EA57